MAKTGSTLIQWEDYAGYFYLQTDSEKLVLTLAAVGIRPYDKDENGIFCYELPTAWLRLRVPKKGLIKLGWYPTAKQRQKGCLVLMEERPKLKLVK